MKHIHQDSFSALIGCFITRWLRVFVQVVVMNGCGSLFSCIAAVICDPKGRFRHASTYNPPNAPLSVLRAYKCAQAGSRVCLPLLPASQIIGEIERAHFKEHTRPHKSRVCLPLQTRLRFKLCSKLFLLARIKSRVSISAHIYLFTTNRP